MHATRRLSLVAFVSILSVAGGVRAATPGAATAPSMFAKAKSAITTSLANHADRREQKRDFKAWHATLSPADAKRYKSGVASDHIGFNSGVGSFFTGVAGGFGMMIADMSSKLTWDPSRVGTTVVTAMVSAPLLASSARMAYVNVHERRVATNTQILKQAMHDGVEVSPARVQKWAHAGEINAYQLKLVDPKKDVDP